MKSYKIMDDEGDILTFFVSDDQRQFTLYDHNNELVYELTDTEDEYQLNTSIPKKIDYYQGSLLSLFLRLVGKYDSGLSMKYRLYEEVTEI